ncbi:DUF5565 family protein [Streptomyces sp. SPB074]|uniref:RNA ligase 1 family protein n=1 Tax=Streptomyces sp. (strain SPB074) TaxID=465543 RepID=UPI00017F0E74|nr:DUF5565 family protein [Streptomyces sp. SPB074]EDY43944.1 mucin-1 [Streptomyces sp. SPB074]
MRKIPTLFVRDPEDRRSVLPEVTPGCEWALAVEGTATRKWDGTCTMLDTDGTWWARREVKPGKTPPEHFVAVERDEVTGKAVGWEPVEQSPFARFHAEALANGPVSTPGTYELLGPKINANPERLGAHILIAHGWAPLSERRELAATPRGFDGLRAWLLAHPTWEGIVWHHPDGRRAKLKRRDFPAGGRS